MLTVVIIGLGLACMMLAGVVTGLSFRVARLEKHVHTHAVIGEDRKPYQGPALHRTADMIAPPEACSHGWVDWDECPVCCH